MVASWRQFSGCELATSLEEIGRTEDDSTCRHYEPARDTRTSEFELGVDWFDDRRAARTTSHDGGRSA